MTIDDLFADCTDISVNRFGNTVERMFYNTERYEFDFKLCRYTDGWKQYDTDQDAWYFGIWINIDVMVIIAYVEGDVSRTRCKTVESFNNEIEHMNSFYAPGAACVVNKI